MKKRQIPSSEMINKRKEVLRNYKSLVSIDGDFYGFEEGNGKVGKYGNKGEVVLVWNLPPVISCPGASECLEYCYNADLRPDIYHIKAWCVNMFWAKNKKHECIDAINNTLQNYEMPLVRVHSSGDFFSVDYIKMWLEIAKKNKHAIFWAYTRSWKIPKLYKWIVKLSQLPNFNIIASIDRRETAPIGMRYCCVGVDYERSDMFNCPEQYFGGKQCIECKECLSKKNSNIYFIMH